MSPTPNQPGSENDPAASAGPRPRVGDRATERADSAS